MESPITGRRQQDREFEALWEISNQLTRIFEIEDLLRTVARLVVEKLRVHVCVIRLKDPNTGVHSVRTVHGLDHWTPGTGPLVVWKGAFLDALESGKPVCVPDARNDPRVRCLPAARDAGVHSMLAVALLAEGEVLGVLSAYTDRFHEFPAEEQRTIEVLGNQAALGIRAARQHTELVEKKIMDKELEVAERVQNAFMPQKLTLSGHYEICARTMPCWQIGGDFYDLVEFGKNHLGVAIGDVSGKGIGASILMATTRSALRAHIENIYAVRDILNRVNLGLCRDTPPDQFVTLFYMVMEPGGKTTYANAGHCPPIVFRKGSFFELTDGGPILGAAPWVEVEEGAARLESGDLLVLYTDGFTEAFSALGEGFGVERLRSAVTEHKSLSSERLAETLYRAIDEYSGHQPPSDDRTLVVIKVK